MVTGDPKGEAKAAEQAMATTMAQASGLMPSLAATSMASGAIRMAVAVLFMNRPRPAVNRNSPVKVTKGPAWANRKRKPVEACVMRPVFCMARARASMPATRAGFASL